MTNKTRITVYAIRFARKARMLRSEEHTSELQSQSNLVCRLLLEKNSRRGSHSGVAWPAILAPRRVHLALLALTGLFVVAMLASIGQASCLFTFLFESLEPALKALVIVNDDFRHWAPFFLSDLRHTNLASGSCRCKANRGATSCSDHPEHEDEGERPSARRRDSYSPPRGTPWSRAPRLSPRRARTRAAIRANRNPWRH